MVYKNLNILGPACSPSRSAAVEESIRERYLAEMKFMMDEERQRLAVLLLLNDYYELPPYFPTDHDGLYDVFCRGDIPSELLSSDAVNKWLKTANLIRHKNAAHEA